jgi:hypothetical protein
MRKTTQAKSSKQQQMLDLSSPRTLYWKHFHLPHSVEFWTPSRSNQLFRCVPRWKNIKFAFNSLLHFRVGSIWKMSKFTLVNLSVFFVVFITQGETVSSPMVLIHALECFAIETVRMGLIRIYVTFSVDYAGSRKILRMNKWFGLTRLRESARLFLIKCKKVKWDELKEKKI